MGARTNTLIGCLILIAAIASIQFPEEEQEPIKEKYTPPPPIREVCTDYTIWEWLDFLAERNNLDPIMLRAIINIESGGDPNAVSRTQDYGLMQINEKYFEFYYYRTPEFNLEYEIPDDILDPYANISAGVNALTYFRDYLSETQYNSQNDYLNCYNRGFQYLKDLNQNYADKVIAEMEKIKTENIF